MSLLHAKPTDETISLWFTAASHATHNLVSTVLKPSLHPQLRNNNFMKWAQCLEEINRVDLMLTLELKSFFQKLISWP